jgi:hypothetical protein
MGLELSRNPNGPHVAVVTVSYEVMERFPNGELSGAPVDRGVKLVRFEGFDRVDAQKKARSFLETLRGD